MSVFQRPVTYRENTKKQKTQPESISKYPKNWRPSSGQNSLQLLNFVVTLEQPEEYRRKKYGNSGI